MGKRGPKLTKGAAVGARVSVETRARLEAAAKASGLSISDEVENRLARSLERETTEDYLLELLRLCIEGAENFTAQSWLADPFTFDVMDRTMRDLLEAFRPEGEGDWPERLKRFAGLPPQIFCHMLARRITDALQLPDRQPTREKRAFFKRAAKYLEGLLVQPISNLPDKEQST